MILASLLRKRVAIAISLSLLVVGCANPSAPSGQAPTGGPSVGGESPRSSAPKRIAIAMRGDPKTFSAKLNSAAGAGGVPGVAEIEQLLNAGLANQETNGALHVQIAEALPTVENGLWKVNPDGTMETTWKIRGGTKWHDGSLLTSADLAFTAQVEQDASLPIFRNVAYAAIDSVETPDPSTVVVKWKRPYIEADSMFTNARGLPMPRHLLEKTYLEDKENFPNLAYWSREFVGSGAYKLREFVPGSHALLDANSEYILGRPKIDSIEIKFIPDPSTIAANILAGEVDLTIGGRLSVEWAVQVRNQWRDGQMSSGAANSGISFYPQFLNPNPPIQLDVNFRRALLHAVDRQQIIDSIVEGVAPIQHANVGPAHAEWREVEQSVVKYDYDPRRAEQLLAGLGLTKGPDGILRDATGTRLSVETRTTANDDSQVKTMLSVVDYWRAVGVATEQTMVPPQRSSDREYRATRPAFEVVRQPGGWRELERLYGGNTPLPENNFTGVNRPRHQNPEFDVLIDRFFTTIPQRERIDILRRIVSYVSDQLIILGMFWDPSPTMISNRVKNVTSPGDVWDVERWEVQ